MICMQYIIPIFNGFFLMQEYLKAKKKYIVNATFHWYIIYLTLGPSNKQWVCESVTVLPFLLKGMLFLHLFHVMHLKAGPRV